MTMIIAAHLEDYILIAADRRAMHFDLDTASMSFANDQQQKIQHWSGGAITGTGEKLFLDRVAQAFKQHDAHPTVFQPLQMIFKQLQARVLEGLPAQALANNTIIYSIFDGQHCKLFSIPIQAMLSALAEAPFDFNAKFQHEIQPHRIEVTCFQLPTDFSRLQHFQANLRAIHSFSQREDAISYYVQQLKLIFAEQAAFDPSVSHTFDVYMQSFNSREHINVNVRSVEQIARTTNKE